MTELYDQISSNKWKTWAFILFFVVLIFSLAYVLGQLTGFGESAGVIAIVLAVVLTVGNFYYSDKIVLASVNARPAEKKEFPVLYNTVEALTIAAGIPMPRVYVIDNDSINAFATGRDPEHAIVVVNTGTLKKLNKVELEGVIAHELSHVKNYDIRMIMFAAVMVGAVAILAHILLRSGWFMGSGGSGRRGGGRATAILFVVGILLAILAPLFARLAALAISRKREYLADATGALLTRYPEGLAAALEKIKNDKAPPMKVGQEVAPLFISNPFKVNVKSWFSTHPPLEERIAILRKM